MTFVTCATASCLCHHPGVRAVVQRVSRARVLVAGEVVGEIGPGLCALVGVARGDDGATAARLAAKLWGLRVMPDEAGRMDRPVAEAGGAVLVVSQFTLCADTSRGRRPSYAGAAPPEEAEPVVGAVVAALRDLGAEVATGRFRADMDVELVNDGPVTLVLDV